MGRVEKTAGKAVASGSETAPVIDSTGTDPETPVTDQTPREGRDALRAVLSKGEIFDDAPKPSAAALERADLQAKETAYLTAFKDLERKKGIMKRLFNGKSLNEDAARVEALKREYDGASVAYADAITKNVGAAADTRTENFESRITARYEKLKAGGMLPVTEDGDPVSLETYLKRAAVREGGAAERVAGYLAFREVVRPLAEKKLAARKEALDTKGRNVFEKTIMWSATQNQRLEKRFGKLGSKAIRALAGAVLIGGGAAALGSFGTASLIGIAGWGTVKFAQSFGGAVLGTMGGELAARAYGKFRGEGVREDAQRSLVSAGRNAGALDLEALTRIDAKRDRLASRADVATLEKKKAIVKALVAFGIGAGAAASLAEWTSVHHVAEAAAGGTPEGSLPEAATDTHPSVASAEQRVGVPETPPVPSGTPEGLATGVSIHESGAGFNSLFIDLKEAAHANLSGMETHSAVLKHLNEMSPTELSREVGALVGNDSMVMHEGDRLFIDEGGKLWFARMDGEPQLLMENGPNGELLTHKLTGFEIPSSAATAEPAPEPLTVENSEPSTPKVDSSVEAGASESHESAPVTIETTNVPDTEIHPSSRGVVSLERFSEGETAPGPVPERPQSLASGGVVSIDQFNAELAAQETARAAGESIVNIHGIEILPAVSTVYETVRPGSDVAYTVVSGGTPEQSAALAEQYANTHPGATVYFETPVRDPLTGTITMRTDVWDSVEGTPATRLTNIVPDPEVSGAQLPSMNTANFTRKLS